MMPKCAGCGELTNPNRAGVMREIKGWERVRRQGGANSIFDRRETGRVLCPTCVTVREYAGTTDQEVLFS